MTLWPKCRCSVKIILGQAPHLHRYAGSEFWGFFGFLWPYEYRVMSLYLNVSWRLYCRDLYCSTCICKVLWPPWIALNVSIFFFMFKKGSKSSDRKTFSVLSSIIPKFKIRNIDPAFLFLQTFYTFKMKMKTEPVTFECEMILCQLISNENKKAVCIFI